MNAQISEAHDAKLCGSLGDTVQQRTTSIMGDSDTSVPSDTSPPSTTTNEYGSVSTKLDEIMLPVETPTAELVLSPQHLSALDD